MATLVGLLALWELADLIFSFDKVILPSPIEIIGAFFQNFSKLIAETGVTMIEAVFGFVLGSASAYLLAIVFVHSPAIQKAVYPYAVALKSTPLVAIAPLLVVWFGNGMLSKVVMSALVAFFPVLVNSVSGLANIDQELLDLMKSLSASQWQILIKIRIPNSLGYLFASLKTATSMSVVGAVIGEYTGATEGIGHLINTSSYYLDTPLMFAAIVCISVSGILFFNLMGILEKKLVFWKNPS
ncbi:MAG: ABC transporter permease [Methylomonas sp.]|nr:ABC transporter permease [Methylomonas sp.]